ncbi:hypothetical protein ACIOJD_33765 [Streptomyces sp. NPDC088116]|uniref:hypothetical protein n=1 Tax=Streptomyces sp. NPDC088116 TaxID=3365825 RepID=UPI003806A149
MNVTRYPAVSPAAVFEQVRTPLLAYVHNRLSQIDWPEAETFARMAWADAVGQLRLAADTGMEDGIPSWLAAAARRVIREQTSPALLAALRFGTTTALLTAAARSENQGRDFDALPPPVLAA